MKWPWNAYQTKGDQNRLALAHLPHVRWGAVDGQSLMRDGYIGNAVVYRCIRLIAEAAASIPMRANLPGVDAMLNTPSPDVSGRALREHLFADLQITGNAWLEAITLPSDDMPKGLFAWPALAARTVIDGNGRLAGHALRLKRGERLVRTDTHGWCSVLHLKLYNPADTKRGLSPMVAARRALDLHNQAAAWAKSLIDNAARPSGALVYGKTGAHLSEDQFERLKSELMRDYAGPGNAGRPLLLEGGLDWKPMSLTPVEMDFRETRHAAAREIASVFGVPPMLLGIPGDNTYANYREANAAFWRMSVLPLVNKAADALRVWLTEPFGDLDITPDLENIPAFSAERDALWSRIGAADFLTDAEKRGLLGLDA